MLVAAGAAAGAADLGQHRRRDGEGLDPALGHRGGGADCSRTQEIISRNFLSLQFYFLAGFLYFVINYGIERLGKYVERKTAVPS